MYKKMKKSRVVFVAAAVMAAQCGIAAMLPVETGFGWKDGWVAEWKGNVPGLEVRDSSTKVRDGLVKVVRRWTWNG